MIVPFYKVNEFDNRIEQEEFSDYMPVPGTTKKIKIHEIADETDWRDGYLIIEYDDGTWERISGDPLVKDKFNVLRDTGWITTTGGGGVGIHFDHFFPHTFINTAPDVEQWFYLDVATYSRREWVDPGSTSPVGHWQYTDLPNIELHGCPQGVPDNYIRCIEVADRYNAPEYKAVIMTFLIKRANCMYDIEGHVIPSFIDVFSTDNLRRPIEGIRVYSFQVLTDGYD